MRATSAKIGLDVSPGRFSARGMTSSRRLGDGSQATGNGHAGLRGCEERDPSPCLSGCGHRHPQRVRSIRAMDGSGTERDAAEAPWTKQTFSKGCSLQRWRPGSNRRWPHAHTKVTAFSDCARETMDQPDRGGRECRNSRGSRRPYRWLSVCLADGSRTDPREGPFGFAPEVNMWTRRAHKPVVNSNQRLRVDPIADALGDRAGRSTRTVRTVGDEPWTLIVVVPRSSVRHSEQLKRW
jgi:hypothetical protein